MFVIVVAGCCIFFSFVNWGLPTELYPDERAIVHSAIRMAERRTFDPDVFWRPDHTLIKINMLIYNAISYALKTPIAELNVINPGIFVLASRLLTGLFSVGCVILSYWVGKKINPRTGLICAALFAAFPIFTTHAHYVTPDMPITFLLLLFIYLSINYIGNPTVSTLAGMAFVTAAFTATKYPGLILCIMIAISIIAVSVADKQYARVLKHGSLAILMVIGFLFIISPILFIRFDAVWRELQNQSGGHLGADGLGFFGNLWYYIKLYTNNCGIILTLLFLFGCYVLAKKTRSFKETIPIWYSFIYWICLSIVSLHWERWALPMFVSPLMLTAIGVDAFLSKIPFSKPHIHRKEFMLTTILSLLVIANLIVGSTVRLFEFILPDTRVLSQSFCESNGINSDNTCYENYTPFSTILLFNQNGFFEQFTVQDHQCFLDDENKQYVITSSIMFARYRAEPERYPQANNLYDAIEDSFTLIKKYEIAPKPQANSIEAVNIYRNIRYISQARRLGAVGPELNIYKVNK